MNKILYFFHIFHICFVTVTKNAQLSVFCKKKMSEKKQKEDEIRLKNVQNVVMATKLMVAKQTAATNLVSVPPTDETSNLF